MNAIRHVDGHDRADVEAVLAVVRAAFEVRPDLDPPAPALAETVESLEASLQARGGLLATDGDQPVAALVFADAGPLLGLTRVSVLPGRQGGGLARGLVSAAEATARRRGLRGLALTARVELPDTITFWERLGYTVVDRDGHLLTLARLFELEVDAPTADACRAVGERLAGLLGAGDLVVMTGDLGAGKTTMTQGIGAGLGVRGQVTSPTFVIARVHPSLRGGPPLVHVDAYRLGGLDELDDLDLDASLDEAVTVVEWGTGLAERLSADRLEVEITRARGDESGEARHVVVRPVGARWTTAPLDGVLDAVPTA